MPWRFYCYGSGGICPAYYLMGSVAAPPVLAAKLAGSSVGAAPVFSIIMAGVYFIVIMMLVKFDVSRSLKNGETFLPTGEEILKQQMESNGDTEHLPSPLIALLPMLLVVFLAAFGIAPVIALVAGSIAGIVLSLNKLKGVLKQTINTGAASVFSALIGVSAAAALGTVIKSVSG